LGSVGALTREPRCVSRVAPVRCVGRRVATTSSAVYVSGRGLVSAESRAAFSSWWVSFFGSSAPHGRQARIACRRVIALLRTALVGD
jgi:hypothetical protein